MKSKSLLTLGLFLTSFTGFGTTWTIVNSGFSFSPSSITISQGDTVVFTLAGSHNATEVSQTTWNANGTTMLTGGFQTLFGGGTVLPVQLGVGTHYFVCQPHASMGMKGQIIVQSSTGIDENPSLAGITIFPNPTADKISIVSDKSKIGTTYTLSDQSGKQVLSGRINEENQMIDLSTIAAGAYFFRIDQDRKRALQIIKE